MTLSFTARVLRRCEGVAVQLDGARILRQR
jgi:hypothetical protein